MTEKIPGCVWTNEAVTLLLSLYLREQQKDRPVKLKKKEIWKNICSELFSRGLLCSWQECDKKYRNLKQTFVRNLKQAGKKECRWMFFPIMFEINKHEPFVNEMVNSALFHNVSSSNTSTSDYENDNTEEDYEEEEEEIEQSLDEDQYAEEKLFPMNNMHLVNKSSTMELMNLSNKWQKYPHNNNQRPLLYQPYSSYPSVLKRSPKSPKSPSPHPPAIASAIGSPPPQSMTLFPPPPPLPIHHQLSSLPPVPKHNFDSPLDFRFIDTQSIKMTNRQNSPAQEICTTDSTTSSSEEPTTDDEPPKWFKSFLQEFKKHEDRKLQKINDLCAEVRRTNDIEHQRNLMLSERNDIMKSMIDCMTNK